MKTLIATFIVGLLLPSAALARERPTFMQAHMAAHIVLDDYAAVVDGKLTVGPCRRAGEFSTICRARIDGPVPERYRVFVTSLKLDFLVFVRANSQRGSGRCQTSAC
jgi:hypothetical protein